MATLRQIVDASVALQKEADKLGELRDNRQRLAARATDIQNQLAIAVQDVASQRVVLDQGQGQHQVAGAENEDALVRGVVGHARSDGDRHRGCLGAGRGPSQLHGVLDGNRLDRAGDTGTTAIGSGRTDEPTTPTSDGSASDGTTSTATNGTASS